MRRFYSTSTSSVAPHEAGDLRAVPVSASDSSGASPALSVGARSGVRNVSVHGDRRQSGGLTRGRTAVLALADAIALAIAIATTYTVANAVAAPAIIAPSWLIVVLAVIVLPSLVAVFTLYNLYEGQHRSISSATLDDAGTLFHALLAGSLLFLITSQVLKRVMGAEILFPVEAAMFLGTALPLVLASRAVARRHVLPAVTQPRRTLIVGSGDVGQAVERKILAHREYGLELVGYVDEELPTGGTVPLVGRPIDLPQIVDELEIDWVIVAFGHASYAETLELLRAARRPDVHLSIVPRYFEVFASNAQIQDLDGMPIVNLPLMRLSRTGRFVKRSVDIAASGLGLIVLAPLFATVAVMIKLDSRGPVFFRQERHGRGGSVFRIVKFRTMRDGAETERMALADRNEIEGALFKIKDDPRITGVGRILRPTSIDELPQLWNVLRGQMSLVGPRPFVVHESTQISGWASQRLDLTPGITGLWQVLGRNDIPFDEMVKLDYIYVTSWSLWWDVKILLQTIPVVLSKRGAY